MNETPGREGSARPWLARLHPNLFSIPLGLIGLAGAWRQLVLLGHTVGNPISLWLFVSGVAVFALLLLLWLAKSLKHPGTVRQEWNHPVQGPQFALAPLCVLAATATAANAFPFGPSFWLPPVLIALAVQGVLAWQVVARLSSGQMPGELVTPLLYLPTVAGGFIGALCLNAIGYDGWAAVFFGLGLGAWALLEMRILNRLFAGPLPLALRASLGLEIAPGAVGALAVASLWPTLPALVPALCIGVALAPLFAVLTRWRFLAAVPFSAGMWSFSFPLAALAAATAETVRRGEWDGWIALGAVAAASAVIAFLALRTISLALRGKLLPPQ